MTSEHFSESWHALTFLSFVCFSFPFPPVISGVLGGKLGKYRLDRLRGYLGANKLSLISTSPRGTSEASPGPNGAGFRPWHDAPSRVASRIPRFRTVVMHPIDPGENPMNSATIRHFAAAGLVGALALAIGASAEACSQRRHSSGCGHRRGLFAGMKHRQHAAPVAEPCAPVVYEAAPVVEGAPQAAPSAQAAPTGQAPPLDSAVAAPSPAGDVAPPAPPIPRTATPGTLAPVAPPSAPVLAPDPANAAPAPAPPVPAPPGAPTVPREPNVAAPAVPTVPGIPAVPSVPK